MVRSKDSCSCTGLYFSRAKRIQPESWFGQRKLTKKRRISHDDSDDSEQDFSYFEMSDFPPMMHYASWYNKVMVRKSYVVIFDELMQKVKDSLQKNSDANFLVTGNPGIGKSRFYLYCIFRLLGLLEDREKGKEKLLEDREKGKEKLLEMPAFQLVLHFGTNVHKYCSAEFCEVGEEEQRQLRSEKNVLRLIEGHASTLTGWRGVSILFSSPGLPGLNQYEKLGSARYLLPVWTLEELLENNSLLEDPLRLNHEDVVARYRKYGGIPRSIFSNSTLVDFDLERAINSSDALQIINFVKQGHAVTEKHYRHHLLCMVSQRQDCFAIYYLDILSSYICDRLIGKVTQDSLHKVSEFAIDHAADHSANTAVLRGRLYENLCHRMFRQEKPVQLRCRSLFTSCDSLMLNVPAGLRYCRFEKFEDIINIGSGQWMYCQPKSRTFGGLHAFILKPKIASGGNDIYCYGLQMTMNEDHGIKSEPMLTFRDELKKLQIEVEEFVFVFVVPTTLERSFKKQRILTKDGAEHQRPGDLRQMKQYVASLDPFFHKE